jgi:hypothetical protein
LRARFAAIDAGRLLDCADIAPYSFYRVSNPRLVTPAMVTTVMFITAVVIAVVVHIVLARLALAPFTCPNLAFTPFAFALRHYVYRTNLDIRLRLDVDGLRLNIH